jgi:hypothetical protein
VSPSLADGVGRADQGVATLLFVAAALFGWVFVRRIRRKGFPSLPIGLAWVSAVAAATALVSAIVLPPIIRPENATRPRSPARVEIEAPQDGAISESVKVPVRVRVIGGRVVRTTSADLTSDTGHVHLYLDRRLIFMAYSLRKVLSVTPGRHTLQAEFVAVDHEPFNPRVLDSVSFTVRP